LQVGQGGNVDPLDKVVDKILSYKPEKKKRENRPDLCDCPTTTLKGAENDRRKNG
jgi:hypothetical protein